MSRLRRHATTIALSLLALASTAALLIFDRGSVTTQEAETRKKNLLEAFRRDEVSELSVTARGRSARIVRGAPDANGQRPWEVEIEGRRYPAEEQTVDQYLGSLEFAAFERRASEGSEGRASLGLDTPQVAITLTMGDRPMHASIGGPAPTPQGALYAEVDGRGIVVITAQLAAALDVDPDMFRSRALVPYASTDLAALSLEGKGGTRRLSRAPWGGSRGPAFRFDGSTPEGLARVSARSLDKVLTALGSLQAEVFLKDDEADRASSKEVTLTLTRQQADAPIALDIGGACPGHEDLVVMIRRSPARISACVPKALLEPLSIPAEELVDKRVIAAPIDAVIEVLLDSDGRTLELARKGTAWHMRSPTDRDVEAEVGRSFVELLLKVEAPSVIGGTWPDADSPSPDLRALALSPPRATVRVISTQETGDGDAGDQDRTELLEIGAEKDGLVHVRRVEDGALLAIPADHAAVLFPSDVALRSRAVINEPGRRFRALRVRAGNVVQRLRRTSGDGDGWEFLEPSGAGLEADTALTNELIERLGTLEADRWVTLKDDGALGLDKPRMVIEADLGDEEESGEESGEEGGEGAAGKRAGSDRAEARDGGAPVTLRLAIGAVASPGSFARLGADTSAFVTPKELEAAASRWLIDRSSLRVDPSSIARVTLKAEGGSKIVVERSGDTWKVLEGESGKDGSKKAAEPAGAEPRAKSSAEIAAAVRDALADLVAEGAVSVGKPREHEGLDKPQLTLDIERSPSPDAVAQGKPKPTRIALGAGDVWQGTRVVYARRSGVSATFAVAQAKVRPLLDAVGAR